MLLQHHLLPPLLLVAALQVGFDHHLHLLLTNLGRTTQYYYIAGAVAGVGVSLNNPMR